jgi:hypothetical protein
MSFNLNSFDGNAEEHLESHEFVPDYVNSMGEREQSVVRAVEEAVRNVVKAFGGHVRASASGHAASESGPGDSVVIHVFGVLEPDAVPPAAREPMPIADALAASPSEPEQTTEAPLSDSGVVGAYPIPTETAPTESPAQEEQSPESDSDPRSGEALSDVPPSGDAEGAAPTVAEQAADPAVEPEQMVSDHSKDELVAAAGEAGVDVKSADTKTDIAENLTADAEGSA